MSSENDKFKNEMFKIHSGEHPLGEQSKQINQERVIANCLPNDGVKWKKDDLSIVVFTTAPISNEEVALVLGRSPGAINNIKKYIRNILIKPNGFGYKVDGSRDPRQSTFWQVYDMLESYGVFEWPEREKTEISKYLPGKQNDYSRTAKYIARNT